MNASLSPLAILGIIVAYFGLLILVSYLTNRGGTDNDDFFVGGRKSPWPLVAIGMIGASLSGVTFISIPGAVGAGGVNQAFSYMQVVLGYLLGYAFIALVLLPLYYRLGLTSIYQYLEERIGRHGYKIGAFYFLLSRVVGAAFRLFLVASVFQAFVAGPFGLPFAFTVAITIILIWLYTYQGGIKTIVYTDTLQTVCMLTAAALTVYFIGDALDKDLTGMIAMIRQSDYAQWWFFEGGWTDPNNFFKQFLSGALITIVMTGLDQDMMQKNLSMPNYRDAQKNMAVFSFVLVFANLLFLALGALLYLYAANVGLGIPERSDLLYPTIALVNLPPAAGVIFILGLIAAAYSSADSALTALTTSFCVDFLGLAGPSATDQGGAAGKGPFAGFKKLSSKQQRLRVHIGFSVLLFLVIMAFQVINNDAVINNLFRAAGYTYGPLLGLFAFGLLTNYRVRETFTVGRVEVPALILVCVLSPIVSIIVDLNSAELLNGFEFGFLILAFNGLLTFVGLIALSEFGEDSA